MKISFITTVFNEEKTIERFLESLLVQTKLPDEIVIVDGGSTDKTIERIANCELRIKKKRVIFKLITKKGNRSVGRNEAIRKATGDVIVCSDAGNVLDKKWMENITKPFTGKSVDVVAGYYKGRAKNVFQKCLIPYALVMPDKVDPENFLPATRSVAFTKAIWKKVGGFDEKFSHNEDYVFANKLKDAGAKIVFAKDAIVNWIPRSTFKEAFVMFFRFALGDAESGMLRDKVLLLFARYFLGFYLIFLSLLYRSFVPVAIILASFIFYIFWSIKKNYKYVKDKEAIGILPRMQLVADLAVLSGTIFGALKRIIRFNYFSYIKQNKFLLFVLSVYVGILLLSLRWGIPNQNHPFPYHMDEWHQLQAVANTFRYGTPNTAGSANGTMFHFLLSGFYLIPFMLLKIIDPFALQIDNWVMRERIFEILRLQTIIFGVLSIFVLYRIAELIKVSKKLSILLFTFTPIWLMLSGYFKYDIALMFWILLSIYFMFYFAEKPSNRNLLLMAIPSSLAVAVKVSAIPLLAIYIFSYFCFNPFWKKNIRYLFLGIVLFACSVFLFGMPDLLFGKGNVYDYVYTNIIVGPRDMSNFQLGMQPLSYLFFRHYPIIFSGGLIFLVIGSIILLVHLLFRENFIKNLGKYKQEIFLFFSLAVFILSLLPLQIYAGGNRSLVLLPFMVLIVASAYSKLHSARYVKLFAVVVILALVGFQLFESSLWIHKKVVKSPQEISSDWIQKNISKGQLIGLENIPIYQEIPDIFQKEFYFQQHAIKGAYRYKYEIVDSKSRNLPSLIVLANNDIEEKLLKESPKKDLVQRLESKGYKRIVAFRPEIKMDERDFYFSWLVAVPNTITVFKKF